MQEHSTKASFSSLKKACANAIAGTKSTLKRVSDLLAKGISDLLKQNEPDYAKTDAEIDALVRDTVETVDDKLKGFEFREPGRVQYSLGQIFILIRLAQNAGVHGTVDMERWFDTHHNDLKNVSEVLGCRLSRTTLLRFYKNVPHEYFGEKMADVVIADYIRIRIEDGTYHTNELGMRDVLTFDGQIIRASQHLKVNQPDEGEGNEHESGFVLTQLYSANYKVTISQKICKKKNNEADAAIRMMKKEFVYNTVVTCDALNSTNAVAKHVLDCKADYFFGVKKNNRNAYNAADDFFTDVLYAKKEGRKIDGLISEECTINAGGNGLYVTKQIHIMPIKLFPLKKSKKKKAFENFPGAETVSCIITETRVLRTNEVYRDIKYFISSLEADKEKNPNVAMDFLYIKRKEWTVQTCHKAIDYYFRQDGKGFMDENSADVSTTMTKFALNALSRERNRLNDNPTVTTPVTHGYVMEACNTDIWYNFKIFKDGLNLSLAKPEAPTIDDKERWLKEQEARDKQIADWNHGLKSIEQQQAQDEILNGLKPVPSGAPPIGSGCMTFRLDAVIPEHRIGMRMRRSMVDGWNGMSSATA